MTPKRPGRPPLDETRELVAVRLPPKQAEWLRQHGKTKTIQRLVEDAMSEQFIYTADEAKLKATAEQVYAIVDGSNHRQHKAKKLAAMYAWLLDGQEERFDLDLLAQEWREYEKEQAAQQ